MKAKKILLAIMVICMLVSATAILSSCEYIEEFIPDMHNHTLELVDEVPATCTTDGVAAHYICSGCEKLFADKEGSAEISAPAVIEKLGHSFTNYASNNDATCTADGTKTAKCDRCDVTDTLVEEGSKLAHSFTNYVSNDDATCTADGTKTAKCDNCYKTDTVADAGSKLAHSFTNYVSNGDATCTADGTKTAKCDNCSETDTLVDEDSKVAHSFTSYVSNGDATCTADGTKTAKCDRCDATDTKADEGSALNHSFTNYLSNNDATCIADGTKTAKCDRCDVTDTLADEGSKLGHSFTNYVSNNDATCLADGTKTAKCDRCDDTDTLADEGSKLGHSFTNYVSNNDASCTADGTKTAKCDRCDATDTLADEGSKLGHSFTNYVSDNNATCLADGTKTAKCDRCDVTDTKADEGSALDHSFTNYVSNNDATCTADGTKTAKCDRCDVTDTLVDEGSMKKHSPAEAVQENYVAASCKDNGSYDSVVYCSAEDCKFVISRETITVPATGEHIYATEQGRVEATCTADGYVIMACGCGTTQTTTLPALNHDEVAHEAKAPTCTEIGWDAYVTCSRCDYTTYEEKAALEHNYNDGVVTTAPTCNEAGVKTFTCANDASHTYTETVDALGHDEVNHDEKAPTCTEIGWDAYVTCSRCDYTTYAEKVATGHTEVIDNVAVDATCTEVGYTEGKHCSVCNTVLSVKEEIPATGHSVEYFKAADATFDSEGNFEYYSCLNCGKTFSDDACTVETTAIILPKLSLTDYTATTTVADSVVTIVFTLISDTVEYSVSVVADSYLLINSGNGDIYVSKYDCATLNNENVTVTYEDGKGYIYTIVEGATESLTSISSSGASFNVIVSAGSTLNCSTLNYASGNSIIVDGTLNSTGITITGGAVFDDSYEYGVIPGLYVRRGTVNLTGGLVTNSVQVGSEAENAYGVLNITVNENTTKVNNIKDNTTDGKIKHVFALGEYNAVNLDTANNVSAIYVRSKNGAYVDIRKGMTITLTGGYASTMSEWLEKYYTHFYSIEEGATIESGNSDVVVRFGKDNSGGAVYCWTTATINIDGELKTVKVTKIFEYSKKSSHTSGKTSFYTPVEDAVYTTGTETVSCQHLGTFKVATDANGNTIYYQE